ncbi:GyrI-like domain-containing protein [Oxalobacteraceae bacterium]|nr:GyrI-like domain-containing protein [Oxalobacteraceae bacterium]
MEAQVQELPGVTVAYLRYKGAFGAPIGDFWKEVFTPWQQASGLTGRTTYGVAQDDPSTTPAGECRYDACVEVPDDYQPGGPAKLATLAGGRYAVTHFKGRGDQIPGAWQAFFGDWFPHSGLQLDQRPSFERYPANYVMDPETGVFECDLCIAVK